MKCSISLHCTHHIIFTIDACDHIIKRAGTLYKIVTWKVICMHSTNIKECIPYECCKETARGHIDLHHNPTIIYHVCP